MQTPSDNQSSELLHKLGTYTFVKLKINPKTAALAPEIEACSDEVWNTSLNTQKASIMVMEKEAFVDSKDELLDGIVKQFSDDLHNDCGRDRKAPRYTFVFLNGITPFTQPRLFKQVETTEKMIRHLKTAKNDPIIDEYLPKIEEALSELKESLVPYKESIEALETAKSTEYVARRQFVATYVSTYGIVLSIMGSKRHTEPFFRRFRAHRKS